MIDHKMDKNESILMTTASCTARFGQSNENFTHIKNYLGKLQSIWANGLATLQCLFTFRERYSHITSDQLTQDSESLIIIQISQFDML